MTPAEVDAMHSDRLQNVIAFTRHEPFHKFFASG
jgi:hypothetical protein